MANMYLICKQFENKMFYMFLIVLNGGNHFFLIYYPVFCWFFLNYADFAHNISHTKPSINMTQLLVPKSLQVWKSRGDEAVDRNKHL